MIEINDKKMITLLIDDIDKSCPMDQFNTRLDQLGLVQYKCCYYKESNNRILVTYGNE